MNVRPDTPVIRPVTVAVANAKGGVGKTSLVANLSGWMARAGHRVLAIDLDPQGNLAHDLGYLDRTDNGRRLFDVLRGNAEPATVHDVRPGLDVWCGGPHLARSVGALIPSTANPLVSVLSNVADLYDVVFIDCPPSLGPLIDAALLSADQLIVPVRADHASLHGLEMIGERFREVRTLNLDLQLLGVTIFDVSRSATALAVEVARSIQLGFDGANPRILPAIRRSERAAYDMRGSGRLAHEYAAAHPGSSSAANLAADYEALALETLTVLRHDPRFGDRSV
jgi:chromosome partitioning protein